MKSNWDNLGPPHVLRPDQVEPSVQFMKPWDIGYVAQEYVVAKTDLSMWVYKAARLYADKEVDPLASDDLYRLVRTDSDLVLEVVEGPLQAGEGLNRLVEQTHT